MKWAAHGTMAKAKDPICAMMVDTEKAPAKGIYGTETVYFCSPVCKQTYDARRKSA